MAARRERRPRAGYPGRRSEPSLGANDREPGIPARRERVNEMAKRKLAAIVKIQIPAGQATPAPPVGTALGPHGINIMDFCKAYNAATESQRGLVIPAEISIYEDRSFTFVTKTPPTPFLLRQAAGDREGRGEPAYRQGREGHARPGAPDRRDEDARPQRHRSRRRDAAGCRAPPDRWESRSATSASPSPPAERPRRRSLGHRGSLSRRRTNDEARQEVHRRRHGRYDRERLYPATEALDLVKSLATHKFDETVEAAFRLGVDPRKADQMIRGTVSLPKGTGKDVRVAVFAEGDAAREAEEAGADVVGSDDLVAQIEKGFLDFDVAIATPDMMPKVGKLGRTLGPRNLMPNPKAGNGQQRSRQDGRRVQGRQGRVPHRPLRERPRADRQGELRVRRPAHQLPGRARRSAPRQAGVVEGPVPAGASPLSSSMGPGVHVDPDRHPRRARQVLGVTVALR